MNKTMKKINILLSLLLVFVLCINMTAYAEDDSESIDTEQSSFTEIDGEAIDFVEYVDGIYNVSKNARASMTGVIRLGKNGSKLFANYSTDYTYAVDKIGIKNLKLQYKGSLGIWHNIITLDNRYSTNSSTYQGGFSCSGVIGRTYRLKATHYVINGSYTETRNNVTENFTF